MKEKQYSLTKRETTFVASFRAMASPCEVIFDTIHESEATELANLVTSEIWRIEKKYSRFNPGSEISKINKSNGQLVSIDDETCQLLEFAKQCFILSEGLFDISCGVLKNAWNFTDNGEFKLPGKEEINRLIKNVGYSRVVLEKNKVRIPSGMELDLGGIGKEYAADKASELLAQNAKFSSLVNLGGDLIVNGGRKNDQPWHSGIEHPHFPRQAIAHLGLRKGALATSGTIKQFVEEGGKIYSHILNPLTGWPVEQAPTSITVAAPTCTQAGILTTLAVLHGKGAKDFLDSQDVMYWLIANSSVNKSI